MWIFEPCPGGHRLQYVRALAEGAIQQTDSVVLATSRKVLESEEFQVHLADLVSAPGGPRIVEVCEGDAHHFGYRRRALKNLLRQCGEGSVVLFPEGDHVMLPWCLIWRVRPTAVFLMMRSGGATIRARAACAFKGLAAGCVMLLNRGAVVRLAPVLVRDSGNQRTSRHLERYRSVPDLLPSRPTVSQTRARQLMELQAQAPVYLLAGSIDARKSPEELLDWLMRSRLTPPPVLLVVGKLDADTETLFAGPAARRLTAEGRLKVISRYVTNEELGWAYAASDAVLVLYTNTGPSGALAHAVASQRPTIVWGNPEVVTLVGDLGIGVVADDRSAAALDLAATSLDDSRDEILDRLAIVFTRSSSDFYPEMMKAIGRAPCSTLH